MKKLCIVLALFLLIATTGCSTPDSKQNSLPEIYIQTAKGYVEDGDYATAMAVLEEGVAKTGDARVAACLEEIKKQTTDENDISSEDGVIGSGEDAKVEKPSETTGETSRVDYSAYSGSWGNGALRVSVDGQRMEIYFCSKQGSYDRIAEFTEYAFLSQIVEGELQIAFVDNWNNSGLLVLYFADNVINAEVREVSLDPDAMWSVGEGAYSFYKDTSQDGSGLEQNNENLLDDFTLAERVRLNVFLSNFSEQGFEEYPCSDFEMLKYAALFNVINQPGAVVRAQGGIVMKKSVVDNVLNRFFGKTVSLKESICDYYGDEEREHFSIDYDNCSYDDYCMDDYNYFSIATHVKTNANGTYTVRFNVYYLMYGLALSPYYVKSDESAKQADELQYVYSGEAVLKLDIDDLAIHQVVKYKRFGQ